MRRTLNRLSLLLLVASGVMAGALAHGGTVPTPHPDNTRGLEEVGTGRHGKAWVLIDPLTPQPMPHTPYRLVISNARIEPIHDVTDAEGMTKFVRTRRPAKGYIIERVGDGNFGKSYHFVVKDSDVQSIFSIASSGRMGVSSKGSPIPTATRSMSRVTGPKRSASSCSTLRGSPHGMVRQSPDLRADCVPRPHIFGSVSGSQPGSVSRQCNEP